MDQDALMERLLDQNEKLIEALTRTNPVEILKALNPPPVYPQYQQPWSGDEGHPEPPEDPWGDPRLANAQVVPLRGGWTDPPFKAPDTEIATGEDSGSATGTEPD